MLNSSPTEEQLRERALELAIQTGGNLNIADFVIPNAEKYLKFLKGEKLTDADHL